MVMTKYPIAERSAAAGVAYVHALAASAQLIWREMTGKDIGIDGRKLKRCWKQPLNYPVY
jgi:hypothetical protein